jgi:glycerol-3-phosphate acyltransferase PlsY
MLIFQVLWVVMAYILGSIPFGVVIAKTFCKIDPREAGSHSSGATNVSRLCGLPYGIATLACDVLKGTFPVWGAFWLSPDPFFISLAGLACVLGHVFSCFMGFGGGKAVATSIGVFIPLAFWPLLGSCALCMLVIWRSGYVSLGSLSLLASLPIFLIFVGLWQWVPLSLCLCIIVFVKHRENISRLRNGTEKPWLKSKAKERGSN